MKSVFAGVVVAVVLVFGVIVSLRTGGRVNDTPADGAVNAANNVSIVDGVQIVTIKAKGGYAPSKTIAKAGIPTVIRFVTKGTFDCSSAVVIPSLRIEKNLPPSGSTDIDVGTLGPGTLQVTCGMGMYRFEVIAKE